jgi:hypothetical protein
MSRRATNVNLPLLIFFMAGAILKRNRQQKT